MIREDFEKECYFLARHSKEYLTDGSFNNRMIQLIMKLGSEEQKLYAPLMEGLISKGPVYNEADEKYAPILIYYQDPVCYGVLNHFADCMKTSLEAMGEVVETFDLSKRPIEELMNFFGMRFKAIIGFQTYAFSIRMKDDTLLHDYITGPKFNMLLDHPVTFTNHFRNSPANFYVLTHDRTYQSYIKENFPEVSGCFILPPGGTEFFGEKSYNADLGQSETVEESAPEKPYDLSFVGTFSDTKMCLQMMLEANRKTGGLARKLLREMKNNPNETLEVAVSNAVGEKLSGDRFRELSHELRSVYLTVMFFYREQIVRAILDEGIRLDVFGDSWKNKKLQGYDNLIVHSAVLPEENAEIFAKSKTSLNIMSWHKDGMTERIAGITLNHAVLVSDYSQYLCENLMNDKAAVLFDLNSYKADRFKGLAARIKALLDTAMDEERRDICDEAYTFARDRFTWDKRAKELMNLIETV